MTQAEKQVCPNCGSQNHIHCTREQDMPLAQAIAETAEKVLQESRQQEREELAKQVLDAIQAAHVSALGPDGEREYLIQRIEQIILKREEELQKHYDHVGAALSDECEETAKLKSQLAAAQERIREQQFECKARKAGTAGGNYPQDCDWPSCGCDPYADKVLNAITESGFRIVKESELSRLTEERDQARQEAFKTLASAMKKVYPEAVKIILDSVAEQNAAYEEFVAFLREGK